MNKLQLLLSCFTILCLFAQCENVVALESTSKIISSTNYNGPIAPLPSDRLKASGGKIVKPNGEEFIIKGLGLGGWMIQEGYMLGASGAQWEIKSFLNSLAGEDATNDFYNSWLNNFVTEADIEEIARLGYNTIRVPLHYNLFFDASGQWINDVTQNRGMSMLHQLFYWAGKNNLHVIPDLHAAPGGQGKNKDISDYNSSFPGLWDSTTNKDMTVILWGKIAQEFTSYDCIGGYDLINEVNYDFENTGDASGGACTINAPLRALYKRIISEIRKYDSNRILFIEGNAYANNFNGLKELVSQDFPTDLNLAFSFHKYWNSNNQGDISKFINLRTTYNRPIWLGETGENSNAWFAQMAKLMEANSIGWSNWPWKKITTFDGPVLVTATTEWTKLMQYKKNSSNPKPTTAEAQKAMVDIVEKIKLENCTPFPDVSFAYIYGSHNITKPYKNVSTSDVINATDYDMGTYNDTWNDVDYINTSGSSKPESYWNGGFSYRNDGVDIYPTTNSLLPNGHYVGGIKDGEWLSYTIQVEQTGQYDLMLLVTGYGGSITISINGQPVITSFALPNTNSYSVWISVNVGSLHLDAGTSLIKILFNTGNFNLGTIHFEKNTTALNLVRSKNQPTKQWIVFPTFSTNGNINFESLNNTSQRVKVVISNSAGTIIKSLVKQSGFELQRSDFIPGCYIASITNNFGTENHRFVIAG